MSERAGIPVAKRMVEAVLEGKSPQEVIEGYGMNIQHLGDWLGYFDEMMDQMESWDAHGSEPPEDAPASYERDWDKMVKALKAAHKLSVSFEKKYRKYHEY
jgi:hypothetical protein